MNYKILLTVFSVFLLIAVSGCSPKLPDGMPKIFPCVLTLTQEGKPAEGFDVQLVAKGEKISWMIGGTSDAQGLVKIMTHGQFNGAPAGLFAVVINKTLTEGVDQNADVQTKPVMIYSLTEKKYNSELTTPLEVKIEGKTNVTFDLGKPVKILTETIRP